MAISQAIIDQTIQTWISGYPLGYPENVEHFNWLTDFADYLCDLRSRDDYVVDATIERMWDTACTLIEAYEDKHMEGWLAS